MKLLISHKEIVYLLIMGWIMCGEMLTLVAKVVSTSSAVARGTL